MPIPAPCVICDHAGSSPTYDSLAQCGHAMHAECCATLSAVGTRPACPICGEALAPMPYKIKRRHGKGISIDVRRSPEESTVTHAKLLTSEKALASHLHHALKADFGAFKVAQAGGVDLMTCSHCARSSMCVGIHLCGPWYQAAGVAKRHEMCGLHGPRLAPSVSIDTSVPSSSLEETSSSSIEEEPTSPAPAALPTTTPMKGKLPVESGSPASILDLGAFGSPAM